jgi:maltokinase
MSVAAAGVDNILRDHGLIDSLDAVATYVAAQRWSAGLGRAVREVTVEDAAVLVDAEATLLFTVTRITYTSGTAVRYALPLGFRPVGDALAERAPDYMIGVASTPRGERLLYDALGDPAYIHWLWNRIRGRETVRTAIAALRFECPDPETLEASPTPAVRPLRVEQSNTSMEIGDTAFLKHLRRVEAGPAHELEMAEALRRARFTHFAPILGTGLYAEPGAAETPFVLVQPFLHNASEGWALALTSLRDMYADAEEPGERDPAQRRAIVDDQRAAFLGEAARLGTVVAEMHITLADGGLGEPFEPTPITTTVLAGWADEMTASLDSLLSRGDETTTAVRAVRGQVVARFDALRTVEPGGLCTRIHGDIHLGQTLRTDSGWIILDFEGEPDRSPPERRQLSTPLRDVAGMLRSFDYAAAAALAERLVPASAEWEELMAYGDDWAQANRDAFWAAYLETVGQRGLLPEAGAALTVRRAFEVHKAVYEVGYELGHRPSWAAIPLRFLTRGAG